MTAKRKSTAQQKLDSVEAFKAWVHDKVATDTLQDYVRAGRLIRSEIAREIGIARSGFTTNDLLKAELLAAEEKLIKAGALKHPSSAEKDGRNPSALESKLASKEREVNALRERLAVKTAENEELRKKLTANSTLLDDLIPSGRRVRV